MLKIKCSIILAVFISFILLVENPLKTPKIHLLDYIYQKRGTHSFKFLFLNTVYFMMAVSLLLFYFQLFGSGIQPHHCDLTNMDGVVTVTPRSMDAETYVEGLRISETTMLQSGMKVQFGASHVFKFVDPSQDHALAKRPAEGGLTVKGPRQKPG